MLTPQEALDQLRRITFKVRIEKNAEGDWEWGTGFFVSPDGHALTTFHNLPAAVQENGTGTVDAYYKGRWLTLDCLVAESLPEHEGDIGVLKFRNWQSPSVTDVESLPVAYLEPGLSQLGRSQCWAGRAVCVLGFPCEGGGQSERFVDGTLDSAQPLVGADLKSEQGSGPSITHTTEWLRFCATERARELKGISGAPVLDRETGFIVAVEHRYIPDLNVVYATEIARLAPKWPALGRFARRLPPPRDSEFERLLPTYLKQVIEDSSSLDLSSLVLEVVADRARGTLPLARVYTRLDVLRSKEGRPPGMRRSPSAEEMTEENRRQSVVSFVSAHSCAVVLGDPGSGKTTLTNYLALCLAGERLGLPDANLRRLGEDWQHGALVPLRILLRDFIARRASTAADPADQFWDYVSKRLGPALKDFLAPLRSHWGQNGGLLILDGLDEVPDTNDLREEVQKVVKEIRHQLPSLRILLTCRTYAYHPPDPQRQRPDTRLGGFEEAVLAPFDADQINGFVDAWYAQAAAQRQHLGMVPGAP